MAAPLPAFTGGTGEFRLDVEAAEEAIGILEGVRWQIESAHDEAVKLARAAPTAYDPVSLEAFALLSQKADGGSGSFTAAMIAGRDHVQSLISQLRADIALQRDLDDAAANGFAGRA